MKYSYPLKKPGNIRKANFSCYFIKKSVKQLQFCEEKSCQKKAQGITMLLNRNEKKDVKYGMLL